MALSRATASACLMEANEDSTLRKEASTTTTITIMVMMTMDSTRENPCRGRGDCKGGDFTGTLLKLNNPSDLDQRITPFEG